MSHRAGSIRGLRFSGDEVRDLLLAWIALGVAFAVFFGGGGRVFDRPEAFASLLLLSLFTAGIGFLLHELAHKVVAVRFGQVAEFRANYAMLFFAVAAAFAGFIFAAPGAVYHRGMVTARENGIIAAAGPWTNLVLGLLFLPLLFVPVDFVLRLGVYGVLINFFLAAFNMLPFGPLDGRKVVRWSKPIFLLTFGLSVVLTLLAVVVLFL